MRRQIRVHVQGRWLLVLEDKSVRIEMYTSRGKGRTWKNELLLIKKAGSIVTAIKLKNDRRKEEHGEVWAALKRCLLCTDAAFMTTRTLVFKLDTSSSVQKKKPYAVCLVLILNCGNSQNKQTQTLFTDPWVAILRLRGSTEKNPDSLYFYLVISNYLNVLNLFRVKAGRYNHYCDGLHHDKCFCNIVISFHTICF